MTILPRIMTDYDIYTMMGEGYQRFYLIHRRFLAISMAFHGITWWLAAFGGRNGTLLAPMRRKMKIPANIDTVHIWNYLLFLLGNYYLIIYYCLIIH